MPVKDDFSDILHDARDAAKTKAKKALREQNKNEWLCEVTIQGNTSVVSGITFNVDGEGEDSGKYIATKVTHTIPGYTTKIEGRKVLHGY